MVMGGQGKKVVAELLIAFVVILLLLVFRPMFIGQVATAAEPYNISVNGVQETVTPSSTISASQADSIYSIVIFLVAIIALVVILLTVAGKI